MINRKQLFLFLSCMFFLPLTILSYPKLSLPRFATIKSSEANARRGPGVQFPIEWVFIKKFEPIEIIEEYDQWRKIRDINNEGGWVHTRVLSGKRSVIIKGEATVDLRKNSDHISKIIAVLSPNLRCLLNKCNKEYCKIKCSNYRGWVSKKNLWGIYPEEEI